MPSKTAIAEEEEGEVVEQSRHMKEVDTSARLEAESVLKEVDGHSIH